MCRIRDLVIALVKDDSEHLISSAVSLWLMITVLRFATKSHTVLRVIPCSHGHGRCVEWALFKKYWLLEEPQNEAKLDSAKPILKTNDSKTKWSKNQRVQFLQKEWTTQNQTNTKLSQFIKLSKCIQPIKKNSDEHIKNAVQKMTKHQWTSDPCVPF